MIRCRRWFRFLCATSAVNEAGRAEGAYHEEAPCFLLCQYIHTSMSMISARVHAASAMRWAERHDNFDTADASFKHFDAWSLTTPQRHEKAMHRHRPSTAVALALIGEACTITASLPNTRNIDISPYWQLNKQKFISFLRYHHTPLMARLLHTTSPSLAGRESRDRHPHVKCSSLFESRTQKACLAAFCFLLLDASRIFALNIIWFRVAAISPDRCCTFCYFCADDDIFFLPLRDNAASIARWHKHFGWDLYFCMIARYNALINCASFELFSADSGDFDGLADNTHIHAPLVW